MAQRALTTKSWEDTIDKLWSLQSTGVALQESSKLRPRVLEMMKNYCERAEIDFSQLKNVIHVAGTKGKGSTCALCESICRHHGMSTGLFTSPHLVDVRERIRINGRPIPKKDFIRHFWRIFDLLDKSQDRAVPHTPAFPSYFRFLAILAFSAFIEARIEVPVIEVGMGGMLDATNILPSTAASGVCRLDYDHTNVLGSTLEEIAREKAGIFRGGTPAFSVHQEKGPCEVLRQYAEEVGTVLTGVTTLEDPSVAVGLLGDHQRENAALALKLCGVIDPKLEELNENTLNGLSRCSWPGRGHLLEKENGSILCLDGAHTIASIECCLRWFKTEAETRKLDNRVLLFNASHEKDVVGLIRPLAASKAFSRAVFAPFLDARPSLQSLPTFNDLLGREAESPELESWQRTQSALWNHFSGGESGVAAGSISEALTLLAAEPNRAILVTGSLYLVGGVLKESGWAPE